MNQYKFICAAMFICKKYNIFLNKVDKLNRFDDEICLCSVYNQYTNNKCCIDKDFDSRRRTSRK